MSAMFQQNTQEINWWAIILPSVITGIFLVVVQVLIAYWLSRKTEDYKNAFSLDLKSFESSLNKRLEDYKKDINKDLYQFQTKFSLLHQREADAIAKIYEVLIDLGTVVEHTYYKDGEQRQQATKESIDKYHEYIQIYLKNQIYFDDDLCESIEEVRDLVSEMTDRYRVSAMYNGVDRTLLPFKAKAGEAEIDAHQKFRVEFPKLRKKLRNKFRQILSAEITNNQIEKLSASLEANK